MGMRGGEGRYRMPAVFGTSTGPRQGPEGQRFGYADSPRIVSTVSFLTSEEKLSRLLPPRCELDGEPVVTVQHSVLQDQEWLAGRGYSMLGVRYPVHYKGPEEHVRGTFLSILWENMADPIITGREELGFAKLYCELPPARIAFGKRTISALWDSHEFMRMTIEDLRPADPPGPPPAHFEGTLHHRYFPKVGKIGESDVDEMVISPVRGLTTVTDWFMRGRGSVEFFKATWEQMPTQYHIPNILSDLPVLEVRDVTVTGLRGGSDWFDQRVLR